MKVLARPEGWSDADMANLLTHTIGEVVDPTWVSSRMQLRRGTHPKDLVTVQAEGGPPRHYFVKFGGTFSASMEDPRGGVVYERRVYGELLSRLEATTVRWYDTENFVEAVLVVEGLATAQQVSKVRGGAAFVAAAGWLGSFHRETADWADSRDLAWLKRYDAKLLRLWCDPEAAASAPGTYREAMLYLLEQAIPDLAADADSVIHGEFYPKNILYDAGRVYPIDWESAGIGPAELDLAMLVDGWVPHLRDAAVFEYSTARWDGSTPPGFENRLRSSEMLLHARWLKSEPWDERSSVDPPYRAQMIMDLFASRGAK